MEIAFAGLPRNNRETDTIRSARLYRITRAGQKRLDDEREKWDRLAKAVGKVLRFA
jgi:DNA-binding PadR family transcriptional regulator